MCLHPLPSSPTGSFRGGRVSIRASGLQEPEHSSPSVLPREAWPCLGQCICGPGPSRGKRADLLAGFTEGPRQADLGPAPSPQTTDLLCLAMIALIWYSGYSQRLKSRRVVLKAGMLLSRSSL